MPPNLEQLRRLAKEYFCPHCYEKYEKELEPKIQILLASPLADWRKIEMEVTHLVMKTNGIFQSKKTIDNFLDGNDEVDFRIINLKTYRETKKWSFKRKIDYLYKEGILQVYSYMVLDEAREIRNRMHDFNSYFSERHYLYFNIIRKVVGSLWTSLVTGKDEQSTMWLRDAAETIARQWWFDYYTEGLQIPLTKHLDYMLAIGISTTKPVNINEVGDL